MYKREWKNADGSTATAWAHEYTDPKTGQKHKIQRRLKRDLELALEKLEASQRAARGMPARRFGVSSFA